MTTGSQFRTDTVHRLTRKGHQLKVRVDDLPGGAEYGFILVAGDIADGCLVRIHSRCVYGDVLGSEDCDCAAQLDRSLDLIQAEGSGVLIYLEQEGRGAGLVAKARGKNVQEHTGVDTFSAYRALDLAPDSRDYLLAIVALLRLDLESVRLLTNNPEKIRPLQYVGIRVEVQPLLISPPNEEVRQYLEAKRLERGHRIPEELTAPAAESDRQSQSMPLVGYAFRAPRWRTPKFSSRWDPRRRAQPGPERAVAITLRETDFDTVSVWEDDDRPAASGLRGVRAWLWQELKRRWSADRAQRFGSHASPRIA
ncbi:GTP cyclohydrolase II [Nocardia suismassiliense]|uniref:GTP cyclohydrolase II n=1 Tax=Nocardia suismassiliense TaxID=2077092 RepID=UPI000D1EC03C|nr:GTP cyclohydrolase II [Nocardia suismassiliense]